VKHFTSQWNPDYWLFAVGALLILTVRFGRGGILGLCARWLTRTHRDKAR